MFVVGAFIAFKRSHRWCSHTGKEDLEIEKSRLAAEQEKFRAALEQTKLSYDAEIKRNEILFRSFDHYVAANCELFRAVLPIDKVERVIVRHMFVSVDEVDTHDKNFPIFHLHEKGTDFAIKATLDLSCEDESTIQDSADTIWHCARYPDQYCWVSVAISVHNDKINCATIFAVSSGEFDILTDLISGPPPRLSRGERYFFFIMPLRGWRSQPETACKQTFVR